MKKRILSVALSLALLFGITPVLSAQEQVAISADAVNRFFVANAK